MARVLYLTQVLPYPMDSGAKVRQYHMLQHLTTRHQVDLVSFVRADDSPEAIAHLAGICHSVHAIPMRRSTWLNARSAATGIVTGLPMVVTRDRIAEMSARIRRLCASEAYDLVHADQLSMAEYGMRAVAAGEAAGHRPASILDEHNAIYHLTGRMAHDERRPLRRAITRREAAAFTRYERAMCASYDAVLTVTSEDRDLLMALFDEKEQRSLTSKFSVLPICVDPERTKTVQRSPQGPPMILHLGTMFWPPNVNGVLWFAREVLPLVWQTWPNTRFVIVGKNPPPEVKALAEDSRIEVTGYVSDPEPILAAADAFVVPLHAGGGMRVKILDAWLWGIPIVSTTVGAEGIQLRRDENILIADAPADFASAVVRLLGDANLNAQLRANGRNWVEDNYSWKNAYGIVDNVYRALLSRRLDRTKAVANDANFTHSE